MKIHSSYLRGLTVLALLCLAVPLRAVTIVQSLTHTDTRDFYGNISSDGGAGIKATWDPVLPAGTLESVTVEVKITAEAFATNSNPFGVPAPADVYLVWTPRLLLSLPGRSLSVEGAVQSYSNRALLEMNEYVSVSGSFASTLSITLKGPDAIEAFTGTNPFRVYSQAGLVAGTEFGRGQHSAAFDATITYQTVPDHGHAGAMVALGMICVFITHRTRAFKVQQ